MKRLKVAILGSTGIIGQHLIHKLSYHPWFTVTTLISSQEKYNKKYIDVVDWKIKEKIPNNDFLNYKLESLNTSNIDADIIFSALPEHIANTVEPKLAKNGYIISSNASNLRLDVDIPLIIPEINPNELNLLDIQRKKRKWDGFIVKNPNCSATILALSIAPLIKYGIENIYVSTMQSISGAGYTDLKLYNINENIIPYIKNEEQKIENEIHKIFFPYFSFKKNTDIFNIYSSCNRVPVIDGHLESVFMSFKKETSTQKIINSFINFKPKIHNLPTLPKKTIIIKKEDERPQPKLDINNGKGMSITIGRIRKGIRYNVFGNNAIRGGAGSSILNAELLCQKNII